MSARRIRHIVVVTAIASFGAILWRAFPAEAVEDGTTCGVSDVEYDVVANVAVRNTILGTANGVYPLGSGKLTLRIDHEAVQLMSYELANRLTVQARIGVVSATVVTASHTSTARDPCLGSAQGTLRANTLTWSSSVAGYRSDGTEDCSGAMCGRFGAPSSGTSPFHDASVAVTFNPFTFSPDGSTFTMPYALVSKSSSPRQTTYIALSGRRVKKSCTTSAPACARGVAPTSESTSGSPPSSTAGSRTAR